MEAYTYVRGASGVGQGKGPFISLHEGFLGLPKWAGFLPNGDRLALDLHPYLCFGGQSAATMDTYANTPCTTWGAEMNTSMGAFGLTAAGEFSNAVTDCGLWVNGVGLGTRYEGNYTASPSPKQGSCQTWTDWQAYSATTKGDIKVFAEASMDALQVRGVTESNIQLTDGYSSNRIGSSGLGKLAILPSAERSRLQPGPISLVSSRDGCPQIHVVLLVHARTPAHSTALYQHGKQEEREPARSQHQ
jgi:hypothetical protein